MKKSLIGLILVLVMLIIIFVINCNNSNYKLEYETWFDTKNTFGNGEYQQYINDNGGLDLFNMKYNCTIINSVTNYIEQKDKVFLKGYIYGLNNNSLEVLVVLDLKTNIIKYHVVDCKFEDYMIIYSQQMIGDNKLIIINNLDEFDIEEQNVLKLL